MNTLPMNPHIRLRKMNLKAFVIGALILLVFKPPALHSQETAEMEVYSENGIERSMSAAPQKMDAGLVQPIEFPSEVTGVGQGTIRTGVVETVVEGAGGRPLTDLSLLNSSAVKAEDAQGNLWIMTHKEGVIRFDGECWVWFTKEDGLVDNWVIALDIDPQGEVWVSSIGGISRFDGNRWIAYRGLNDISDISFASNGDIWFGGGGQELYRFDGEAWWVYGHEDGILNPVTIAYVEVDKNGKVWAAITGAEQPNVPPYELVCFDGEKWTSYDLGQRFILSIYADSKNRIWIGSHQGLLVYENHNWLEYGKYWGGVLQMLRKMEKDGCGCVDLTILAS
jgi:hypothetical protein